MTQEEKAKAYDEALEVMRQWIAPCHTKEQLDTLKKSVFPELAESEDERHRKWILEYLYDGLRKTDDQFKEQFKSAIAWLEKQKEPTTEELYAKAGTTEKEYIANTMKMVRAMREKQKEQKPDTRDADDLQLLGFIYDLLNEIEWKDSWAMSKDECLRLLSNYSPQKPAEWSDYKDKVNVPYCSSEPEWSEEDEKQIAQIERIVKNAGCTKMLQEKIHNWFKSLRPSWKPSEEQMEYLAKGIIILGEEGNYKTSGVLNELHNDLKKLL